MAKPCDVRKVSFRITIKQEHILDMLCKLERKTTTELLNDYVSSFIKECLHESKYAVDNYCADYYNEMTRKTDVVMNQLYSYKKTLVSFRLKKDVYELLKNHLYFTDMKSNEVRTATDKELNRVVYSIVAYVLEAKDFTKLCSDLDLDVDVVLSWIDNGYKATY